MGLSSWLLFNSPVLAGLIWTTKNYRNKMAKALAEFKVHHSGEYFIEPSNYDKIPLVKIL
jgi:hypothetical protein